MVDTAAALALAFLGVVVLVNLANGTLVAWLKAKFLHQGAKPTQKILSAPQVLA